MSPASFIAVLATGIIALSLAALALLLHLLGWQGFLIFNAVEIAIVVTVGLVWWAKRCATTAKRVALPRAWVRR